MSLTIWNVSDCLHVYISILIFRVTLVDKEADRRVAASTVSHTFSQFSNLQPNKIYTVKLISVINGQESEPVFVYFFTGNN